MKKARSAALVFLLVCLLAVPARADVIIEPYRNPGGPLDSFLNVLFVVLILAVVAVAVSLLIRAVRKKRKDRGDDQNDGK